MRHPFFALVLAAVLAGSVTPSAAQQEDPRAVPVFDADHPVTAILEAARAKGKALILQLGGGLSYTGKVKAVSAHAVVLTELAGKEFFDAWIPLASIVAIEERVRLR
ncbi:MAG: hypothetical protein H6983_04525 [Ectothiorhodospiraceae bacterium]|nr:hypothetical protein [Ectothiorhodospiraceae bacterium]